MTPNEKTTMYTTTGPVRGTCGHTHKSLRTALRCLQRDRRACAALGGGSYSDRRVVRSDGAPLTEDELDELDELDGLWPLNVADAANPDFDPERHRS